MQRVLMLGLLAIALLGGAYFFVAPEESDQVGLHRDADVVALGLGLYEENCAACHGADLAGQADWQSRDADGYLPAPPHDETGHTWHHPTEQLFAITKLGTEAIVGGSYKSNMTGFSDLMTDAEIHAVLAYIKSTWPRRIIDRHDQMDVDYATATRP